MSRMQYMSAWATSDLRSLVSISDCVLEMISEYQQDEISKAEAGGLILGTVHRGSIVVRDATRPTKYDIRRRTYFERSQEVHQAYAEDQWRKSDGIIRYVGEWHTHPEWFPTPSSIDLAEWRRLARKRKDGRPILSMIGGIEGLFLSLTYSSGCNVALIPINNQK